MRRPSRRAVLGSAVGLVTTTGCLETGDDSTADVDAVPVGTEQTLDGRSVTVSNLTVRDSALTLDDDTMSLHTAADERYVVVSVVGSESGPAPSAFSLALDGETYASRPELFGPYAQLADRGPVYDPSYGTEKGWIGFVVPPAVDASEAAVVVGHGDETATWRLNGSHVDALGRPRAAFELRDVDLPTRLEPDEPLSVRVAAENVSETDGTFRGVLNVANLVAAYAPYPFEVGAEPGETVGWEKTFEEGPPEHVESVGFFLETVAGGRERRATVERRSATRTTG